MKSGLHAESIKSYEIGISNINSNCSDKTFSMMMLHNLPNYLPDDLLVKIGRASRLQSLGCRVSVLDHNFLYLTL